MNVDLNELEAKIGYRFQDQKLLQQALIHPSYSGEMNMKRFECNQRLEFLGDAVLELAVSDHLYRIHEKAEEGELTRKRSSLVFEKALAQCALKLGLGPFIYLGRGEDLSGGRAKPSILSDTFEALVGAIYIDGGFEAAKSFISRNVIYGVKEMSLLKDAKSAVQETVQRQEGAVLDYETTESGEEDPERHFRSVLLINGQIVARGYGRSKKKAEQDAAAQAAKILRKGKKDVS